MRNATAQKAKSEATVGPTRTGSQVEVRSEKTARRVRAEWRTASKSRSAARDGQKTGRAALRLWPLDARLILVALAELEAETHTARDLSLQLIFGDIALTNVHLHEFRNILAKAYCRHHLMSAARFCPSLVIAIARILV